MGALLSLIQGDDNKAEFVFVDFENAAPSTDEEKQIYNTISVVLGKAPGVLESLEKYVGCEDLIKKAIQNPSPETMDEAWEALIPHTEKLKEYYDFSLELSESFPVLLQTLCKGNPQQSIGDLQALTKQLAQIFDFVLRFDDMKMVNPAIQNDFSFYRRSRNQRRLQKGDVASNIQEEVTNRMSLFYAYPTPMMNSIKESILKFLDSVKDEPHGPILRQNVNTALAFIANCCQRIVSKKQCSENYVVFCLRCMTASIILYDNLDAKGAFHKRSPILIKKCICLVKDSNGQYPLESLLNALRFTTTHLQDEETPSTIKQLLQ